MTGPLSIALSGMKAAATRVGAAASNIANAHTVGAREGTAGPAPYTPVDVVQTSVGADSGISQTRADVVDRDPASTPVYMPDAPYADDQGLVAAPNVEYTKEIVDIQMAATAYKANAAVARVASEMDRALLRTFDETA